MADIAKLIYKENTLYGWESGDIKSSNDTYDDIVFLTQAEYDALPSKNPNTLYSTPEGWPAGFDSSNVKAFPLTWTWDSAAVLAEAQDILDWYNAGNTPVVNYQKRTYNLSYYRTYDNYLWFVIADDSYRDINICYIKITHSNWTATSVSANISYASSTFLSKYNTSSYTPSADYNPATKKYVDDQVWDIATLLANI